MATRPKNSTITYDQTKLTADTLYIDPENAQAYTDKIGTDLKHIADVCSKIATQYKKLANDGNTKANLKEELVSLYKAANKRAKWSEYRVTYMTKAMASAFQQYITDYVEKEFTKLQTTITDLQAKVNSLESQTAENTTAIKNNTTAINTNTANISANADKIATNTASISAAHSSETVTGE